MRAPAAFVTRSPKLLEVINQVSKLSSFATTVLITGESGTGKEVLARLIHESSARAKQPFVPVNCGAIPAALIESELFGHKKGAFTDAIKDKRGLFEEANGGTIFLDEIGELPIHLQVKLLRVLQEQQIRRVGDELQIPINVRIVAATLRDLEDDVREGLFRGDLFYRLNVVSLHLPPLRERPEDITLLAEHFLTVLARKLKLPAMRLSAEALQALIECQWRGNIRELENAIERAMVMSTGVMSTGVMSTGVMSSEAQKTHTEIKLENLPPAVLRKVPFGSSASKSAEDANEDLSIKRRTAALELDLITKALKKTAGNRTKAAKILELSHRALLYKLKLQKGSGSF